MRTRCQCAGDAMVGVSAWWAGFRGDGHWRGDCCPGRVRDQLSNGVAVVSGMGRRLEGRGRPERAVRKTPSRKIMEVYFGPGWKGKGNGSPWWQKRAS